MRRVWVKMLLVCIGRTCPELQLLRQRHEVGVGALSPLHQLVPIGGKDMDKDSNTESRSRLESLTLDFKRRRGTDYEQHFWCHVCA